MAPLIRTRRNVALYLQYSAFYVSRPVFSVMLYANKKYKNRCKICDLKKTNFSN